MTNQLMENLSPEIRFMVKLRVDSHIEYIKQNARVTVKGKRVYSELFDSLHEAKESIRIARDRFHGEFANHG